MALIIEGERIEDSLIQQEVERLRPHYEQVFADKLRRVNVLLHSRLCFVLIRVPDIFLERYITHRGPTHSVITMTLSLVLLAFFLPYWLGEIAIMISLVCLTWMWCVKTHVVLRPR